MTAAELTLIDDQVVVACTVDEAMQLLDGPDQIASWFLRGPRRNVNGDHIKSR